MLENDVALVTGASRGIGQAIALALAGAGAKVIGTSTSEAGAAAFGELLASKGYAGRGAVLDVSDPASNWPSSGEPVARDGEVPQPQKAEAEERDEEHAEHA